ncbi:MAG: sodium:calcium antiporter, partial [Clostridia bacterium]|nr:sodium:calcium antiporter [Clostridia bacterium]
LDKKTNLSGALLGGILLAAVTSLPELFTSLTATTLLANPDNHLVLGNILGSNAFNLILFFIPFVIFFKNMVNAKVGKGYLITMGLTGALYATIAIASLVLDRNLLLWGWFNPLSIVIAVIYIISIWLTPKEEEGDDSEGNCTLTVKQIAIRFVIFSLLLVSASIGLTFITDWLTDLFNLGATIGGALFLGVATSLPELTATVNLSKKKNYNAVYGNILGSGVFNCFILSLGDLLSFRCVDSEGHWMTMYKLDQSALLLMASAIISMILVIIASAFLWSNKLKNNIVWKIVYIILGIGILASYVIAVCLSFTDLGIAWAPIA